MPYFIKAYKEGKKEVEPPESMKAGVVSAWYRTTPVTGCEDDGGTRWGQAGEESAKGGASDSVNMIVVVRQGTNVTVSLGGDGKTKRKTVEGKKGASFVQVPFEELDLVGSNGGNVTITMNGETVRGPAIVNECPAAATKKGGKGAFLNFNAVAIQLGPVNGASNCSVAEGAGGPGKKDEPKENWASVTQKISLWIAFLAVLSISVFQAY